MILNWRVLKIGNLFLLLFIPCSFDTYIALLHFYSFYSFSIRLSIGHLHYTTSVDVLLLNDENIIHNFHTLLPLLHVPYSNEHVPVCQYCQKTTQHRFHYR